MTPSSYTTVTIERDEGIAWVTLNRPDKRNAMSPTLNREMLDVLEELEVDDGVGVVVLTGAGHSFTAGMDLKEYFRETDSASAAAKLRIRRAAGEWQWRKLRTYPKPTTAMVNGWCFGGGFYSFGGVRPGDCRRRGDVRPERNQLGHHPRRQRDRAIMR